MKRVHAGGARSDKRRGQAVLEYALLYAGVILPLTFGIVFVAEMLWVWHSVVEFTRDGARYAATHCWQADGQNVIQYMQTHVPRTIDMDQLKGVGTAPAQIVVNYFSRDPDSGSLTDFTCDGECSVDCVPNVVTVRITGYEFRRFVDFLKLPPVAMPEFPTTLPIESAGCDPEQGTCLP